MVKKVKIPTLSQRAREGWGHPALRQILGILLFWGNLR